MIYGSAWYSDTVYIFIYIPVSTYLYIYISTYKIKDGNVHKILKYFDLL